MGSGQPEYFNALSVRIAQDQPIRVHLWLLAHLFGHLLVIGAAVDGWIRSMMSVVSAGLARNSYAVPLHKLTNLFRRRCECVSWPLVKYLLMGCVGPPVSVRIARRSRVSRASRGSEGWALHRPPSLEERATARPISRIHSWDRPKRGRFDGACLCVCTHQPLARWAC